ncbi:hypothetical protein, partial [Bacteroides sp.]|uniref:hypothetical protein n=1 Tax=Bacteroides sp. TaxID=29523 RepID=UPI0023D3911B
RVSCHKGKKYNVKERMTNRKYPLTPDMRIGIGFTKVQGPPLTFFPVKKKKECDLFVMKK